MSTVKANSHQIGQSLTATNNFTLYQPASPDGTVRLGNGNSGSVTDLVTLTSAGNLGIGTSSPSFPNGTGLAVYNSTVPRIKLANSTTGDTATDGTQLLVSGSDFYIQQREAASVIIATNGSDRVTIDSSGNLGLGVTPSGWSSTYKALDLNTYGAIASNAGSVSVWANGYFNGSNSIYKNSNYALIYNQIATAGQHAWYIAPSGTAGNVISWTQAMTLDASGNLLVGGTTSPGSGTGAILTESATGGIGYGTGAGGAVTQLTSKSTGVTINRPSGTITMNNAALAASTSVSFRVDNTTVAAGDTVVLTINGSSVTSATAYLVTPLAGAGFFYVHLRNVSASSYSDTVIIYFTVIKGVAT